MSTVGRLVIDLTLGTAGFTAGLASVRRQLNEFQNRSTGAALSNAQIAANQKVVASTMSVAAAEKAHQAAIMRTSIARAGATSASVKVLAAEAQELRSTIALTEAKRRLASAQYAAANPDTLLKNNAFPMVTAGAIAAMFAMQQFGAASFDAAKKFQYEMVLVHTQADATMEEVGRLSEAILQMAPGVQTAPLDLAKAMFRVKSVGIEEAQALEAVRVAAMGARVGSASLDSVTNGLIATVVSGIGGVNGFEDAMGQLNAIVGVSNLQMETLTASLSSGVLSTARQFGLELLDVGVALGVMSNQGIPAEEAATRLRITIALIGAPTKLAAAELAKIGISSRDIADEMRGPGGLIGALTLLKERMDETGLDAVEQSQLLKTAFGGSRSSAGILTLINSLDQMADTQAEIQEKSGKFLNDFAIESETASAKMATFSATMDVLKIRIGNGLVPVLTTLAVVLGFVAEQTYIVIPLFWLLAAALTFVAARAIAGAIASLFSFIGAMGGTRVAAALMGLMFNSATAGIVIDSAAAATATTAMGASMAGAATGAGTLVMGMAGATGAMASTTAAAGPLITSLAGVSAALGGTAVVTGPVMLGLAGVDGVMVATTASTGALMLGFGGMDGAMIATSASTLPLITSLTALNGELLLTAGATGLMGTTAGIVGPEIIALGTGVDLLIPSNLGAGASAGVAATGIAAEGVAAGAASAPMWSLAAATTAAALPVYVIIGAAVLLVAVLVILVTQTDKVVQRFRIMALQFAETMVTILDIAAKVPGVGTAIEGAVAQAKKGLDVLRAEVVKAQKDINVKEGNGGGLSFTDQVKAIVEQAKYQAQTGTAAIEESMLDMFGASLGSVQAVALVSGASAMKEYADGIKSQRQEVLDGFKELSSALETEMNETAQIAMLYGMMTSHEMADGLASDDAYVVARAEALKKSLTLQLDDLTGGAYSAGEDAGKSWQDAFHDNLIREGKGEVYIANALKNMSVGDMIAEGQAYKALGDAWTNVLKPGADAAATAVDKLRSSMEQGSSVAEQVKMIFDQFGYSLSALNDVASTAGGEFMLAYADGMRANQDAINTELAQLHEMLASSADTSSRIAYILAVLQSEEMARGIADARPDVRAQVEGTRDLLLAELARLVPESFQMGAAAGKAYGDGWAVYTVNAQTGFTVPLSVDDSAMTEAKSKYDSFLKELDEKAKTTSSSMSSSLKSDLTSAFAEIKAKALEYFEAVHTKTMKAIQDAHDHKNALLEAKEALIQGPVDAAQRALDKQRQALQEWRLREAVRTADSPEGYRDAVLALQDFLAQKHINEMQDEVDGQKEVLDARKRANDERLRTQIETENERYEQQRKDFERNLTALERYLKNHPKAWRQTQNKILALLNEYGVSYRTAGNVLGADFAAGLLDQVQAAQDAANALVAAATPGGSTGTSGYGTGTSVNTGSGLPVYGEDAGGVYIPRAAATDDPNGPGRAGGGPTYKGVPTWVGEAGKELFVPSTDGYVLTHGESVKMMDMLTMSSIRPTNVPPGLTGRNELPRGLARINAGEIGNDRAASSGAAKQTIIFQVGEEQFGEITDLALYQQDMRQRRTSVTKVGGSRR